MDFHLLYSTNVPAGHLTGDHMVHESYAGFWFLVIPTSTGVHISGARTVWEDFWGRSTEKAVGRNWGRVVCHLALAKPCAEEGLIHIFQQHKKPQLLVVFRWPSSNYLGKIISFRAPNPSIYHHSGFRPAASMIGHMLMYH